MVQSALFLHWAFHGEFKMLHSRFSFVVLFASALIFAVPSSGVAATSKVVRQAQEGLYCVYNEAKQVWSPAANSKGANFKKAIAKALKKGKSKRATNLKKKRRQQRREKPCDALQNPVTDAADLRELPSIAELAGSREGIENISMSTISGTPPKIVDIPAYPTKNVFWNGEIDAILNGDPTPEQCANFYAGINDGDPAGLSACYVTSGVGEAFQNILSSGSSLCYTKNSATEENFNNGGISIVSGSLPENDITKLFMAAQSADRIVKVVPINLSEEDSENVQGEEEHSEDIFVRIHSADSNASDGFQYRVDFWFCSGGEYADDAEEIQISKSGEFRSVGYGTQGGGAHRFEVFGGLARNDEGQLIFDPGQERTAQVTVVHDNFSFKSSMTLSPDNLIKFKSYNEEEQTDFFRGGYQVAQFEGNRVTDLRVLAGAMKDDELQNSFEYREGQFAGYVTAPESTLKKLLKDVDLNSDPFYDGIGELNSDTSAFRCDEQVDIEVQMDFSVETMQAVAALCEADRLDGMNFCHEDEEIRQAEEDSFEECEF